MEVELAPETEAIIAEEIRSGRYPTAEAVVEAAVARLTEQLAREDREREEHERSL
jgi:Arc/MetJ-type ribon-helix-helix transcriptional regulator